LYNIAKNEAEGSLTHDVQVIDQYIKALIKQNSWRSFADS
jgi:hypothetical protein